MYKIGVSEDILLDNMGGQEGCCVERLDGNNLYDAIIIGLDTKLTRQDWLSLGSPAILSPTTGISHVAKGLWEHTIKLEPKEVCGVSATAEHSFCLFLAACRKINNDIFLPREMWLGQQISGMNAAIFGHGRIGTMVKRYCEAFLMNVKTFDKHNTEKDKVALLGWADVIFIHMTYNDETRNFFNRKHFPLLKSGQMVINTARAQIVEKELLLKCVDAGIWSHVCLDFVNYIDEPYFIDPDLAKRDKIVMTPHIAGNTGESIAEAIEVVMSKFLNRQKK